MVLTRRSLELRIDEIVVDGFGPLERRAVGEAVEAELGRLLVEHGIPAALGRSRHVARPGATVHVAPGDGAADLGRAIGESLYDVLSR